MCGDVDDDGFANDSDVAHFRVFLADPSGSPLIEPDRCTVIDTGSPRPCDILDVTVLRRAVELPPLPSGISPVCVALIP